MQKSPKLVKSNQKNLEAIKSNKKQPEAVSVWMPLLLLQLVWTAKSSQEKSGEGRSSGIVIAIVAVTFEMSNQEEPSKARGK